MAPKDPSNYDFSLTYKALGLKKGDRNQILAYLNDKYPEN